MNCKQGDLAVIHTTQPQPYGGHMVEVVRAVGPIGVDITPDPGHFWEVNPLGWHPGQGLGATFWFPDHRLTPIRDQPGQDETLTWASVPATLEQVPA